MDDLLELVVEEECVGVFEGTHCLLLLLSESSFTTADDSLELFVEEGFVEVFDGTYCLLLLTSDSILWYTFAQKV